MEKEVWKNAYNDLHKQMAINEKKAEDAEVKVKELKKTHKVWKEQEKENMSFRKIVNEQVLANDEVITEKVIKVIKEKTEIVRDTV